MTTTVKIDLNDQGATTTLAALASKFGSTGAAADKMGGAIAGVEGRLGKASAAAKKLGGDIGTSTDKSDGMTAAFRRLALSGGAWQALTYGVQKFNEASKAAAAEGVEPLEISFDRLINRVVEGRDVFASLSSILGKGLSESIFDIDRKAAELDKRVEFRKKRNEAIDKIISDNANRYADAEYAARQRIAAQAEQDAAKKIKSVGEIDAAEKNVLATMKRQREEADQDAVKDSFDAKSIEESNRRKDRARAEGEMKLQTLFARRMELEAQHQEQLKTEIDRIREIIEVEQESGDAGFARIQELKNKEDDLNRQRKDQAAVIRELEDIDHKKRLKQIEDEAARQRAFFDQHKELWQQQQDRENAARQNRIGAIAGGFGNQPGQQGPNAARDFLNQINPRDVQRRLLDARLQDLAAGREGRLAGLQGDALVREQRRIRRDEGNIRRDVAQGVIGGRGGIQQEDVAKALQEAANVRINQIADQKKLNADVVAGFREAVNAEAGLVNLTEQMQKDVDALKKMQDRMLQMIQRAERRGAQLRNR